MSRPAHRKPIPASLGTGTGGKHKVGVPTTVWFTPYQRHLSTDEIRAFIAVEEARVDAELAAILGRGL